MIVIINILIIMYNCYFVSIEIKNISDSIINLYNNAINFFYILIALLININTINNAV